MNALLLVFALLLICLLLLARSNTTTSPLGLHARLIQHNDAVQRDRWLEAKRLFWLELFGRLVHRTRRIWRYCRRHFGWGIEILENAFLYWIP